MPRTIIDTTGPGITQDWEVVGSRPGWQAVQRGSGDLLKIRSQTALQKGYFHCGGGWMPYYGQISAVTVYYRARVSELLTTGTIYVTVIRDGVQEHQNGPVVLTSTNWVNGSIRVRADWLTSTRFNPAGVGYLGVGAYLFTAPGKGYVEVSELWIEVEYIDSVLLYDPLLMGALPDALSGDLQWSTSGAETASITGDKYLSIVDNSPVGYRNYSRLDVVYPSQYVTELESRIEVFQVPLSLTVGFYYYILAYHDGHRSIYLTLFNVFNGQYVGLTGYNLDHDDPNAYLDSARINVLGEDLHFRLTIDRDPDPATIGKVRVYLNYSDTPVLEARYDAFPAVVASNWILFGTGVASPPIQAQRASVLVDFVSWHSYKKHSSIFESWRDVEVGTNYVEATHDDPYIQTPQPVPFVPGMLMGQSTGAAEIHISDIAEDCYIQQYWMVQEESPVTYDLNIDYRMNQVAVQAEVVLQRRSDLRYWDDTTKTWVTSFTSVALPNQLSRGTAAGVMTGIRTTFAAPYEEVFILKVGKHSASVIAHSIFLYHIDLEKA